MYLGVKGKGRKRDDRLPAPAVTQKICLPPPVREGGKGEGDIQAERQPFILFFYDFWVVFFSFLQYASTHSALCSLFASPLSTQTSPNVRACLTQM